MPQIPNSFKFLTDLIVKIKNTKNEQEIINHLIDCFNTEFSNENKNELLRLLLDITPKRNITTKQLKTYTSEITGLPDWIITRSEEETGNFLKAFSLLLRKSSDYDSPSLINWISKISSVDGKKTIPDLIKEIADRDVEERFLLLKLLTGTFKSPVSRILIFNSLGQVLGISAEAVSLRLFKQQVDFEQIKKPVHDEKQKMPMSFPIIELLENESLTSLGNPSDWKGFGKKDGLQAQIVKHDHYVYLWSVDGEILNHWFPEIIEAAKHLGNRIKLQGQIIPLKPNVTLERLQNRTQKKSISGKEIKAFPSVYEIWHASKSQSEINQIAELANFQILKEINVTGWEQIENYRQACRQHGYNGILLQNQKSQDNYLYLKATSFCIKALLIYVEVGSMTNEGIRSLTFGVFNQNKEIIPIAKVDSFSDTLDIKKIIDFTRKNTLERFGPVRTIKPELIYELHFDNITTSKRRKSGIALENMEIFKKIEGTKAETDTLENIKKLNQ